MPTLEIGCLASDQPPVVDEAATAEGLSKDDLLLGSRIEAILVGFLLLDTLQHSIYSVKYQAMPNPGLSKQGTALSSRPMSGDGSSCADQITLPQATQMFPINIMMFKTRSVSVRLR